MNEDKIKELVGFAHFVAEEVFQDDDYWELNYRAFPELVCRRLYKLGIVEKSNGVWHYNPLNLNDDESCGRAEYIGEMNYCSNCEVDMGEGS